MVVRAIRKPTDDLHIRIKIFNISSVTVRYITGNTLTTEVIPVKDLAITRIAGAITLLVVLDTSVLRNGYYRIANTTLSL